MTAVLAGCQPAVTIDTAPAGPCAGTEFPGVQVRYEDGRVVGQIVDPNSGLVLRPNHYRLVFPAGFAVRSGVIVNGRGVEVARDGTILPSVGGCLGPETMFLPSL
jgi:hypothetical protein